MRPDTRLLLASVAGAASTANALRPIRRTGLLSLPAFASGLPTSELPVQTLAAQAVLTAVTGRGGGYRGVRGGLAVSLAGASFAGLVRLHRDSLRAAQTLHQALVDELGSDYLSQVAEPFSLPPEVPLTRRRILLPSLGLRRRYRAVRDVSYGDYGRSNHLDIWRRADLPTAARAPVLVQIHGGGWEWGRKEGQAEPLMGHLAERGWVCVAPNYRLSPRATWPDHIVDVKRALAWVRSNIADHGGDPSFLVVTGGSAGGHLASLAALTPGLAEWQPGFEDADTSVAAAVSFYGVYDFTNRDGSGRADMIPFLEKRVFKSRVAEDLARWRQASPINHVGPDASPFFVLHGTNDSLVRVEHARMFVDELRKASTSPVAYAELPRAQHAFDTLPSPRAHHTAHAVERFLAVIRSAHLGPGPRRSPRGSAA